MNKKKEKLFVEGCDDHESAVNKIAADLDLDPQFVNLVILSFFRTAKRLINKLQNVYLLGFGLFNKTEVGRTQIMLRAAAKRKIATKRMTALYPRYREKILARIRAKAAQRKKEIEELDPWELNELDAQRNPEKWKDRITKEK